MKKIAFLIALCFSLMAFAGCSYPDGKSSDQSQAPAVSTADSVVSAADEEEQQAIAQILNEVIRLYEYGCYGLEYTGGRETSDQEKEYLSGFGAMYCQENNIEYGEASDRQSLIRLAAEEYFNVTFNDDFYFSDIGLDDARISIQPAETVINDDTATVVVQRFLNGEELFDGKYTFKKAEMPQSFEGTIFEQLAYDNYIWKIEKVEAIKDPISSEAVEISNADELIKFSNDVSARKPEAVNGNYVLTADIDLTDNSELMPIGTYNEDEMSDPAALNLKAPMGFNGTFDGAGHTVSGFQLNEQASVLGFFRVLNDDAIVKNLNLQGSVVNNYTEDQRCNAGGFAGIISANAHVENCSFSGDVEGMAAAGGFVGNISYTRNNEKTDEEGFWESGAGLIKDCTSNATVTSAYYAGGFAGCISGNLDNCTANGDVIISKKYGGIPTIIGGFCGDANTQLSNCHCNVKVTHYMEGANRMGNFVGQLDRNGIINCTIKADAVNPDWYMVGMKYHLNVKVDIKVVD